MQNDEKIHHKITIFGACAPYPRLIYCIASSISQGKKDDMSSKSGPCLSLMFKIPEHSTSTLNS
jgi:hypothetical protein